MTVYDRRFLTNSHKLDTSDIDWDEARRHGLTAEERFILTYFSDIESQTIRYLRTLLTLRIAFQPDIASFLTTWAYEEFFHGEALSRLMAECGYPLSESRVADVAKKHRFNERVHEIAGPLFALGFSRYLPAVYTSFGAIQELTTLRGYESLQKLTSNPILAILCERIAKQERRHFAWYFNKAREFLDESRGSQRLTRTVIRLNWKPVGAGVKGDQEVMRLWEILFPADIGKDLMEEVDAKIGTLPGLRNVALLSAFFGAKGRYRRGVAH